MSRLGLLTYLDQKKVGTRLLFAGNLTRQPYMQGQNFRVSGELSNTDNVMNNTFWFDMQSSPTREMLVRGIHDRELSRGQFQLRTE